MAQPVQSSTNRFTLGEPESALIDKLNSEVEQFSRAIERSRALRDGIVQSAIAQRRGVEFVGNLHSYQISLDKGPAGWTVELKQKQGKATEEGV